jgi:putative ABC transport system permease protein
MYRYGYVQYQNAEGLWEYLRVESGDESVFPLSYLEGSAPAEQTEMALSYLNASELGLKTVDTLKIKYQGEELTYTISGIYQDITYGGKTAKAAIDFKESDVEVYIIYLNVKDGVSIAKKTVDLRNILSESKITPIMEFVSQTLGGIMDNMNLVEGAAILISMLLIVLITVMILKLMTAKEHSSIAIKKAIGLTDRDIRIQFGIRIIIIQVVAILSGTILANTLGEAVFGMMLSTMGASRITMLVNPVGAYLLSPAAQLVAVLITVITGTKVVRNYHIRDQIME